MVFKRYGRHRQVQYICLYVLHGSMRWLCIRCDRGHPQCKSDFVTDLTLWRMCREYIDWQIYRNRLSSFTYTRTHAHSHSRPEWTAQGGRPGNFFSHIYAHGADTLRVYGSFFILLSSGSHRSFHDNNLWYGALRSDGANRNGLFHLDHVTMLVFGLPKCFQEPREKTARAEGAKNVPFFLSHLLYTLIIM